MANLDISNAKITFRYSKKMHVANTNYCDDTHSGIGAYCADTYAAFYKIAVEPPIGWKSRIADNPDASSNVSCQLGVDDNNDGTAEPGSYLIPYDPADPTWNDDDFGCTDPNAPEYKSRYNVNCTDPENQEDCTKCLCTGDGCFGCTHASAHGGADSGVTVDDGSCVFVCEDGVCSSPINDHISTYGGIIFPCIPGEYLQTYWYDHDLDSQACTPEAGGSHISSDLFCKDAQDGNYVWWLDTDFLDEDDEYYNQCSCTVNDANSPVYDFIQWVANGGVTSGDGCGFCQDCSSGATVCTDNQFSPHGDQFQTYCVSTAGNGDGFYCDTDDPTTGNIASAAIHYHCISEGIEGIGGDISQGSFNRLWSASAPSGDWIACPDNLCTPAIRGCMDGTAFNNDVSPSGEHVNIDDGTCDYGCGEGVSDGRENSGTGDALNNYLTNCCQDSIQLDGSSVNTSPQNITGYNSFCDKVSGGTGIGYENTNGSIVTEKFCTEVGENFDAYSSNHSYRRSTTATTYSSKDCTYMVHDSLGPQYNATGQWVISSSDLDEFACQDNRKIDLDTYSNTFDQELSSRNFQLKDGNGIAYINALSWPEFCDYGCGSGSAANSSGNFTNFVTTNLIECCVDYNDTIYCDDGGSSATSQSYFDANNKLGCTTIGGTYNGVLATSGSTGNSPLIDATAGSCYSLIYGGAAEHWIPAGSGGEIAGCADPNALNYFTQDVCTSACGGTCGIKEPHSDLSGHVKICPSSPQAGYCDYGCGAGKGEVITSAHPTVLPSHLTTTDAYQGGLPDGVSATDTYTNFYNTNTLAIGAGLKDCAPGYIDNAGINDSTDTFYRNDSGDSGNVSMCTGSLAYEAAWGSRTIALGNDTYLPGYTGFTGDDILGHYVYSSNTKCLGIDITAAGNNGAGGTYTQNTYWWSNLNYGSSTGYFIPSDTTKVASSLFGCTDQSAINYDNSPSTPQAVCSLCPAGNCGESQGTDSESNDYGICPAVNDNSKCDYGCGEGIGDELNDSDMLITCCVDNWQFNAGQGNDYPDNQYLTRAQGGGNSNCDVLNNKLFGDTNNWLQQGGTTTTTRICNGTVGPRWQDDNQHFAYASSCDNFYESHNWLTADFTYGVDAVYVSNNYDDTVNWVTPQQADTFGCKDTDNDGGPSGNTLHWQPYCNYGCGQVVDTVQGSQTYGTNQVALNHIATNAGGLGTGADGDFYQSIEDHDRYNRVECCEDNDGGYTWDQDKYPQEIENNYCDKENFAEGYPNAKACISYAPAEVSGSYGLLPGGDCKVLNLATATDVTSDHQKWSSTYYCFTGASYISTIVEGECKYTYGDAAWYTRPQEVYGCTDTSADNYTTQPNSICSLCPTGECGDQVTDSFWGDIGISQDCPTIHGYYLDGKSNYNVDLKNIYDLYYGPQVVVQGACIYEGCTDPNATNWSVGPRAATEAGGDTFNIQRGKVSSGCTVTDGIADNSDYSCCEYQCGVPAETILNTFSGTGYYPTAIGEGLGPSWLHPDYDNGNFDRIYGSFWSNTSAWHWHTSDTTNFIVDLSKYKYCKPWEICWDDDFQNHCRGTSFSGVLCNTYTDKPTCEADQCAWYHRPMSAYIPDADDNNVWSSHINHCVYNYGDGAGTIPEYYCEDGQTPCTDHTYYGLINDPECQGLGTNFCDVLVYSIGGESAIVGEYTGTGTSLPHKGSGWSKTSVDNQGLIAHGDAAVFACTDTGAKNYICNDNALLEHYQNYGSFIDNNLDPNIWKMYFGDNDIIYTGRCSSACEILEDSTALVGCYTSDINFVSGFSTEYHCVLWGYDWYPDKPGETPTGIAYQTLLGLSKDACCILNDGTIIAGECQKADGAIIEPFDSTGLPDNLVFSNYRGDHLVEVGIDTTMQSSWDFVGIDHIPFGYESDMCQFECGGPWNIPCADSEWHTCQYIEGFGNKCVGKIDIQDYEFTIDEDETLEFDVIIKDIVNMHNQAVEHPNDIYTIEIDRTSDYEYGKLLGRDYADGTEIIYSRMPWVWDKMPHRSQWYYNGWEKDPTYALLISQEDWYGHKIVDDIVQWNKERGVHAPDWFNVVSGQYDAFNAALMGGICSIGFSCYIEEGDGPELMWFNSAYDCQASDYFYPCCSEEITEDCGDPADGTCGLQTPEVCESTDDCSMADAICTTNEFWHYFYDFDIELKERSRFFNFVKLFAEEEWMPPSETIRYTTLTQPDITYNVCHCPDVCTNLDSCAVQGGDGSTCDSCGVQGGDGSSCGGVATPGGIAASGVCSEPVTEDSLKAFIDINKRLQTCDPTKGATINNIPSEFAFECVGCATAACKDTNIYVDYTYPLSYGTDDEIIHGGSPIPTTSDEYNSMIDQYCSSYTDSYSYSGAEDKLSLFLCPGDRIIIEQDNFPLSDAGGLTLPCDSNTWNYLGELTRASFEDRWSTSLYSGTQFELDLAAIMGDDFLADFMPGDFTGGCEPPCGSGEFCIYNECVPEDTLLAPSWLPIGTFTISEIGRRKAIPATEDDEVTSVTYMNIDQYASGDNNDHNLTFMPDSSICSSEYVPYFGGNLQYDPLSTEWGNDTDTVGIGGYYDLYHLRIKRDIVNEMKKSFMFKPYSNQSGTVTFNYTVSRTDDSYFGGITRMVTGTISITINPKEDKPTFDIAYPNYLKASSLSNDSWTFSGGTYIEQKIAAPNIQADLITSSKTYLDVYGDVASKVVILSGGDIRQSFYLPADYYNGSGYFKNINGDILTGTINFMFRKDHWPWTSPSGGAVAIQSISGITGWTKFSFSAFWADDMFETVYVGNDSQLNNHPEYKFYDRYDCGGSDGTYPEMASADEGKIRYSACRDNDGNGNWYVTTSNRSEVLFILDSNLGSTLELGVFGLSLQNSDSSGTLGDLYLTDDDGFILPDRFTAEVNTNILFDPYPREDFDGITITVPQSPVYVDSSIETTADVNIMNTTNSNRLGLGVQSGTFTNFTNGTTQTVSYDLTTPDAQFDYTGVRVFSSGTNRIGTYNQPLFVGHTYIFSFYVRSSGDRYIQPRIGYNETGGIGYETIYHATIDSDGVQSGWTDIGQGYFQVGNNQYCETDGGAFVPYIESEIEDWSDYYNQCFCGVSPVGNQYINGNCVELSSAINNELFTGYNWIIGWDRIAVVRSIDVETSLNYFDANRSLWIDYDSTNPFAELYVWGVQLEEDPVDSADPSNYIPELGGKIKIKYKEEE